MRAAVVTEFGAPLQVSELDLPTPGYGEALVKLETSGVCHTDLHAAHGDWPVKPQPPFVPGHEGYGTVGAQPAAASDNHHGIEQYQRARVISKRSLSCAPYTTA
jgi:propanol-preferring alcohol dehydrogenase